MSFNWYIIHVLSGVENKVVKEIKTRAAVINLSDKFKEFIIPSETQIKVVKGKKTNKENKIFPGYILVNMELNDATWHLVKMIPKVSGFLSSDGKPKEIKESEVQHIIQQMEDSAKAPKQAISFDVGDNVRIIDGPFESFCGIIEEIDPREEKLKISVTILGRATSVELNYNQVIKE